MKGWTITQWIMAIILAAAAIAILMIALPAMGIAIPGWAINMMWVIVIAICAMAAIRVIASMFGGGPPSP